MKVAAICIAILLCSGLAFAQNHAFNYWELKTPQDFKGKKGIIDACVILQLERLSFVGSVAHWQCGWVETSQGVTTGFVPLVVEQITIPRESFAPLASAKGDPKRDLIEDVLMRHYEIVAKIKSENGTPDDQSDDLDYSGTLRLRLSPETVSGF